MISDVESILQKDESELKSAERDRVRDLGDWWDLVALLLNEQKGDIQLIQRLGLDRLMCEFYEKIKGKQFLKKDLPNPRYTHGHVCT